MSERRCDSPELAAMKEKDTALGPELNWHALTPVEKRLATDRRTLLRMVDELTVQFNAERQAYNAIGRERDDLRAKLAELDKLYRDHIDQSCASELELETKLAEAEKRAEAAEARVRELELSIKLIASGNGNIRTEQNR